MLKILELIKAGLLWRDAWIILIPIIVLSIIWLVSKTYYWLRRKHFYEIGYEAGLKDEYQHKHKLIKYYKQGHKQGCKEYEMFRLLQGIKTPNHPIYLNIGKQL